MHPRTKKPIFDRIVVNSSNFKSYFENPPTTEAEYDVLDCWIDKSQAPSWASISSDMASEEVRENRHAEYPSIRDVTVALAEKTEGSSTMWDEITAKRAAVKTKWPKDNSGPVE